MLRALVLALLGLALIAPGLASAAPTCSWNAFADFSVAPDEANPGPDQCGNAGVWSYLAAPTAHTPSSYSLLPYYTASWLSSGQPAWRSTGSYDLPVVAVNRGPTVYPLTITWPANTMLVHPEMTVPVVVAWTSPISGTVAITGGVSSFDATCGNGIAWSIDHGSTVLASGSHPRGGSQSFAAGSDGASLASISVLPGETLYLLVLPNGEYYCDSTGVDLTISQVEPAMPTPELPTLGLAAAGLAVVSLVAVRARRRA